MGSVGVVQPPVLVAPPVGGTAGQALVKSGTLDYVSSWQTLSTTNFIGPEQMKLPSRYLDSRTIPSLITAGGAGINPVSANAGTAYVPVWIPESLTLVNFGVAGFGNSGTINLGVSTASATGMPGTLLQYMSRTLTGSNSYWSVSPNRALSQGWHYFSVGCSTWNTSFSSGITCAPFQYSRRPYSPNPSGPGQLVNSGWFKDLSANIPISDPVVTAGGASSPVPVFWMQVS